MINFNSRVALILLGVLFLLPLTWVNYTSEGDGGENSSMTLKLGLPFSPWLKYEKSTVRQEWGEGPAKSFTTSMNSNFGIEFLSWSSLCFLLAIVCFQLSKWAKRRQPIVIPNTPRTLRSTED